MAVRHIIGIDEVGRGPLAGPLCIGACAVRMSCRAAFLRGIKDSKQLSEAARLRWMTELRTAKAAGKCRYSSAYIGERYVDRSGLRKAIALAVCRALRKLDIEPHSCRVLLDGCLRAPRTYPFQETIIGGDERVPLIAAASIIAKVRRDRYMVRLSRRYPQYGFDKHKGYGTQKHYDALRRYGLSPVHRRSFLKNFAGTVNL